MAGILNQIGELAEGFDYSLARHVRRDSRLVSTFPTVSI